MDYQEKSYDNDIEVLDVDSYGNEKNGAFSHQVLVMKAMHKCIDSGSVEMRSGWFETKHDRSGNTSRIYHEDSRLTFISSIETCMMIMECDLDGEAEEEIKNLLKQKEELKTKLLNDEANEWNALYPVIKSKLISEGRGYIKGYFNKDKMFYQIYLDECVNIYREIFKSLTRQTKRLDFYAEEMITA